MLFGEVDEDCSVNVVAVLLLWCLNCFDHPRLAHSLLKTLRQWVPFEVRQNKHSRLHRNLMRGFFSCLDREQVMRLALSVC